MFSSMIYSILLLATNFLLVNSADVIPSSVTTPSMRGTNTELDYTPRDNMNYLSDQFHSADLHRCGRFMKEDDYAEFSRTLATEGFTCTFAAEDCNNHGVCNQAGTACICDDDYATDDATVETGECNYKRKSGLVALLLSIFVGYTGAPLFYVGETSEALIQLLCAGAGGLFLITIGAGCFGACAGGVVGGEEGASKIGMGLATCAFIGELIAMIVMWIIVLVAVASGTLDDSNGVSLSPI